MSKRAVEAVFTGLFLLTEMRQVFRDTVPDHMLDENQRKQAEKIILKLEKQITILKEEMLP